METLVNLTRYSDPPISSNCSSLLKKFFRVIGFANNPFEIRFEITLNIFLLIIKTYRLMRYYESIQLAARSGS